MMTKFRLLLRPLALLALATLFSTPALAADPAPPADNAAAGDAPLTIDFFYNALAPSGRWIEVENYGPCFQPAIAQTNPDWRPYTDGYWSYTDGGWTWVSYEDFGWATYHYGRWLKVNDYGWTWVPGTEWAPAWVAWREGSGGGENGVANTSYIGWAPLPPPPPQTRVSVAATTTTVESGVPVYYPESYYYGPDVEASFGFGPAYWNFCETRYLGAPLLAGVLLAPGFSPYVCGFTRNVTNIYVVNRGGPRAFYFNGGPSYYALRGRLDRPIPQLRLARETRFAPGAAAYRVNGNTLVAPGPRFVRAANPSAGARAIPANLVQGRVAQAQINRGGEPVRGAAATATGPASAQTRAAALRNTNANRAAASTANSNGMREARQAAARQAQADRQGRLAQQREARASHVAQQRQAQAERNAQRQTAAAQRRAVAPEGRRNRAAVSNRSQERAAFRTERRGANVNRRAATAARAPRGRVVQAAPQREGGGNGGRKKKR